MSVLHALEIDSTLLYQFIITSFCFVALASLAFKPYADAVTEREKATKGGEEAAVEINKNVIELRAQYEQRAREVNTQIREIFDSYRGESQREQETIMTKVREDIQKLSTANRERIHTQVSEATTHLKEEVPQLAQAISSRLLPKKA